MQYPFEGRYSIVDRQTFDALAQHFVLDPRKAPDFDHGYGAFLYDKAKAQALSPEELRDVAPYVLAQSSVFDNLEEKEKKDFVNIMRSRGMTRQSFIEDMMDFEFDAIGPESTQYIGMIAVALEDEYEGRLLFWSDSMTYNGYKSRWNDYQRIFAQENKEAQPFEREAVLKIGAQPIAIDYSPDGKLYVFDDAGTLREFTENNPTDAWHIKDNSSSYAHDQYGACPAQTVIRVRDRELFLMTGPEIEQYDLDNIEKSKRHHQEQALQRWRALDRKKKQTWYHDVCFRDGNIFASTSQDHNLRSIIQFVDGERKIVYQGPYPHNPFGGGFFSDLTLRVGVFNGGLYFPEMNGISVLTAEGPREMLGKYKKEENHIVNIDPLTRFAFGNEFMIAVAETKERETDPFPTLQIFTPVYDTTAGIAKLEQLAQPSHFERTFMTYVPKVTGFMLRSLSIAAHGNRFAHTHKDFERVFVYKMKDRA